MLARRGTHAVPWEKPASCARQVRRFTSLPVIIAEGAERRLTVARSAFLGWLLVVGISVGFLASCLFGLRLSQLNAVCVLEAEAVWMHGQQ